MRTAIILVCLMVVGCTSPRQYRYSSYDDGYEEAIRAQSAHAINHVRNLNQQPYQVPQDPPNLNGPNAPRYLNGTSANIYDGTPYPGGGVRMNNMINYPDGRVEFVR